MNLRTRLLALAVLAVTAPRIGAAATEATRTGFEIPAVCTSSAPAGAADTAPGIGAGDWALAVRTLEDDGRGSWLAQRAIEREWTAGGDSVSGRIPGAKSEMAALSLSALVPGTGQLYVGEASGFAFLAVEVASWIGYVVWGNRGDELAGEAATVAGPPADSLSAWSFQRWAATTQGDPAYLEQLYAVDPDAFYEAIGSDPRYTPGWKDGGTQSSYNDLRNESQQKLEYSNKAMTVIWINHALAAFDALRAARLHNLPLTRNVELKASGRLSRGRPAMTLALERRF